MNYVKNSKKSKERKKISRHPRVIKPNQISQLNLRIQQYSSNHLCPPHLPNLLIHLPKSLLKFLKQIKHPNLKKQNQFLLYLRFKLKFLQKILNLNLLSQKLKLYQINLKRKDQLLLLKKIRILQLMNLYLSLSYPQKILRIKSSRHISHRLSDK